MTQLSTRPGTVSKFAPLVFTAMDTLIAVQSHTRISPDTALGIEEAFAEREQRFSLHRDSEARQVARHELPLDATSAEFRATYWAAVDWGARTDGAFTPHHPAGHIDLFGIVKALAIQEAGDLLTAAGHQDWLINAGGDLWRHGRAPVGEAWTQNLLDPAHRPALLEQYAPHARRAIASAGGRDRGEHVWRRFGDATYRQVSVAADDIVAADVLATAILAGGESTLELALAHWDIDVFATGRDGRSWVTPSTRAA
ncbi:FAD:protein FMN transferase [Granulicoccus phenolivorans]|uniref:FAD:protein FMN transferase n=1 Tax=Granulicoccus phenolivorans TaxID=266854 RepID=UPI0003F96008|nr:FAD:protein FMN transferase [Granulicoccus phenolivorans]